VRVSELNELEAAGAWFVYVLRCCDQTLYTGATNRVGERVAAHNAGRGARYTRGRCPVELVYLERVGGRSAALRREAEIKRLSAERKRSLIAVSAGRLRTAAERAVGDSNAERPDGR